MRSRLFRETYLTLQKAIDICRAAETSTQQLKAMQSLSAEGSVGIVKKKVFKNKPSNSAENKAETIQICRKCGYKHEPRKCPAFGKVCKNRNKRNRFAKKCKNKKIHEVHDNDSDSDILLNSVKTKDQLNEE